jgi:hypothetical protein
VANPFYDSAFGVGGPNGPKLDVAAARALVRGAGYPSLSLDAPVLMSKQALLCNAAETLDKWVAAVQTDRPTADRILADLARAPVGH